MEPSDKSHNAPDTYLTMHLFVAKCVHISVTKWCIVGYGTGASWDLCSRSIKTIYRQVSNRRRTLVGNQIVDHSDVVGAAPVSNIRRTNSKT